MSEPAQNTDRELFRERPDDYYAPSVFVTEGGAIGMNVGGNVVVQTIREWHRLAWKPQRLGVPMERLARIRRADAITGAMGSPLSMLSSGPSDVGFLLAELDALAARVRELEKLLDCKDDGEPLLPDSDRYPFDGWNADDAYYRGRLDERRALRRAALALTHCPATKADHDDARHACVRRKGHPGDHVCHCGKGWGLDQPSDRECICGTAYDYVPCPRHDL